MVERSKQYETVVQGPKEEEIIWGLKQYKKQSSCRILTLFLFLFFLVFPFLMLMQGAELLEENKKLKQKVSEIVICFRCFNLVI